MVNKPPGTIPRQSLYIKDKYVIGSVDTIQGKEQGITAAGKGKVQLL
jgi:hypothetical protein